MSDPITEIVNIFSRWGPSYFRSKIVMVADKNHEILGIRTPFNSKWIESLKMQVPSDKRAWSPEHRAWFISSSYYNIVENITRENFNIEIIEVDTYGLELLTPTVQKSKKVSKNLNSEAIKVLSNITSPMNDKIMFETIIEAYKSGCISQEKALEMIEELINL